MAQNAKLKDTTRNLAKFTTQLASETQTELNKLHRLLDRTNEMLGAVIHLLGAETVESALNEMREQARQALLEKQVAGVKFLVDNKVLLPAETLQAPDGYAVGVDTLADGTERRVQFEMAGITPEFLPLYVGKKVGEVIEGNGAKLTIKEVYTLDREQYAKVMTPKPAEAKQAEGISTPTPGTEPVPESFEAPMPPADADTQAE